MKTIVDLENDLVKPYIDAQDEKYAANIAPIEDGATAVGSYAVGEQFMRNGKLSKAKTAIAQGDALVLNTNYEAAPDVETQIANEEATRSAMGAKNVLRFPYTSTSYGILTINDDGSLTLDGTPTSDFWVAICNNGANDDPFILPAGKYKFSCARDSANVAMTLGIRKVSDDSSLVSMYFTDSNYIEAEFELAEATNVKVRGYISANTPVDGTLYPMLRLATDANADYQPYAKTNKELTDDVSSLNEALSNEVETRGKLGAKNLLPYPYSTDSQVINGVLFTVNTDGTITVTRQSANESQAVFQLASNWTSGLGDKLKGLGAFKFIGGYSNKCYISFWNNSSGAKTSESQSAATSASLPSAATQFNFSIVAATDFTGTCTIKPMILLDSETDLSYVPYAMTNKELTESLTNAIAIKEFTNSSWVLNSTEGGQRLVENIAITGYKPVSAIITSIGGDFNGSSLAICPYLVDDSYIFAHYKTTGTTGTANVTIRVIYVKTGTYVIK